MPSEYEAAKATPSRDLGLEKIRRGPSAWHAIKVRIETQEIHKTSTGLSNAPNQGLTTKTSGHTRFAEVRCPRNSAGFDNESRNEVG